MAAFRDIYAKALDGGIDREVDLLTSPDEPLLGDRVVYRAIYRSMEIHGLPPELEVNGANVSHVKGPVLSQRTDLAQRGGFPLVFDKCMTQGIEIGAGHWLTVVQVEITPLPDDLGLAMFESRDQAREAVAFIASVLDERIAQELLAEDLLILDESGPVAAADLRELVRHFLPYEVTEIEKANLDALDGSEQPRHVKTAARWYLRAAQAGPGVDGVMFLWFAVEALVGTSKKAPIEKALRAAGRDPADQGIGVGRLHGIRSKFVHDDPGKEPPPKEEVRQAFYDLEAMVKTLLRHGLGVESTWPAHLASQVFDSPWAERIDAAWREPETEFHDVLPTSSTKPIEGLSWGQMLPALDINAAVEVSGGQDQDAVRVRRIVEMALFCFGDPDIGGFPVEIRRFDNEEIQADCRDGCLVIGSRTVDPDNPVDAFRLMMQIHVFVGRCLLERRGVKAEGLGVFLHGLLTGWIRVYLGPQDEEAKEFIIVNPLPANPSLFDIGEHLGAGAAGSEENLANVEERVFDGSPEENAEMKAAFKATVQELSEIDSPETLLDLLEQQYAGAGG
jgi:hypothetical protein